MKFSYKENIFHSQKGGKTFPIFFPNIDYIIDESAFFLNE